MTAQAPVRLRTLVITALVFGVLIAVAVAVAVPTHTKGSAPAPQQPVSKIVVLPRAKPKMQRGTAALVVDGAPPRIERRLSDSLGGPGYAVRVFRAKRLIPIGDHPTVATSRLSGHELCAQLGRVYRGQFGWLDAEKRFRPANPSYQDTPIACGDRWHDDRSRPEIRLTTLITDPGLPRASVAGKVLWGFAGSDATSVTLEGATPTRPPIGPSGTFIAAVDPNTPAEGIRATFTYGSHRAMHAIVRRDPERPQNPLAPRAIPGTSRIEARSPDPGGGVAWGVTAFRTSSGSYCVTTPGRIVGGQVGGVDFHLDTFDDARASARHCQFTVQSLPADWPVGIGLMGIGDVPLTIDPTQDPDDGRVAVRTLPGRTVIYGVARDGVREITIASPRDVRTLLPSPRAKSFLAVYDGLFPSGEFKLTALMADGTKKVVTQPAGLGG